MDTGEFPTKAVSVPDRIAKKVASSPYDQLYRNGVTAEGFAYTFKLPTQEAARKRERNRHASNLVHAADRFNRCQPNRQNHLTYRVVTDENVMYVFIVKKFTSVKD